MIVESIQCDMCPKTMQPGESWFAVQTNGSTGTKGEGSPPPVVVHRLLATEHRSNNYQHLCSLTCVEQVLKGALLGDLTCQPKKGA